MIFMPFQILGVFARALLSLAIIASGIGLLWRWNEDRTWTEQVVVVDETPRAVGEVERRDVAPADRRVEAVVHHWQFGPNWPTAYLLGGLGLLATSMGGGLLANRLFRPVGKDEPNADRSGETRRINRPDGSILNVEYYGPIGAPTLVMTHGWGADSTEWYDLKKNLAGRFRLVVWDLPGLGLSTAPTDRDWSLERLAGHLEAVIAASGDGPVILVGHSIGGMTILTHCKLNPGTLRNRVAGLVLVHTTYTNPVATTQGAAIYSAIQKPVLEPLCHVMIALAPVFWLTNWMGYLNGSIHRQVHKSGFAGHESRGRLDFVARYQPKAWPAVVARGMLGMFRYDATSALASIDVPTLVIEGDKDTTTKPEASQYIAANVPGATLATLAPARHMGLIEQHDRFVALVEEFAATHGPVARAASAV